MKKINLLHGFATLTKTEYKKFSQGDTLWGDNSYPEILDTWGIEEIGAAKKALDGLRCSYEKSSELVKIEEYALEFFEADEDGEFLTGSDYDLAETEQNERPEA